MIDKVLAQSLSISGINTPTWDQFNVQFATIFQLVFTILGVIAFLSIVHAGYLMISSGGDATKFAQGKKNLIFSIIGIATVSIAFFVISFVGSLAQILK